MTPSSLPIDPSEVPPAQAQHIPPHHPYPVPPVAPPGVPAPPAGQPPQPTGARKWLLRGLAALTAFGVFGAIGSYYVPKLLDRLDEVVNPKPAPVDVTVVHDRGGTPNFVFPATRDPAEVPASVLTSLDTSEIAAWARDHGGVAADQAMVRFIVRGRDSTLVHVEKIQVKVVKRSAPRAGWYNGWEGCGADVEATELHVNVDGGTTRAEWVDPGGAIEAPSYTVSASDEEVVDLYLTSTEDEIEWVLEVAYSSAAGSGVLTVDDGGRPFVLTTVNAAEEWEVTRDALDRLVRNPAGDGGADGARPTC